MYTAKGEGLPQIGPAFLNSQIADQDNHPEAD